jgi:hypothetical protein
MRPLVVGDVVKCKRFILGNEPGTEGVVYEMYAIGESHGVSVIFANGEYDGFAPDEQALFLERVGHDEWLSGYKFENVMKLSKDFDDGVFDIISN